MDRRSFIAAIAASATASPLAADELPRPQAYAHGPLVRGTLYRVDASPRAGFDWPYLLYIPPELRPGGRLLMVGPNNLVYWDAQALEQVLTGWVADWVAGALSRPLGIPVLLPAFVRPPGGIGGDLYTHSLTRAALETHLARLRRLDLQCLAMARHARGLLNSVQSNPPEAFMTLGYSASGDFAHRMAILHPRRIRCFVAGGLGGLPTLPLGRWRGRELTYPLGVFDLASLTGGPFDVLAFRQVDGLFIQGETDENDAAFELDSYSAAQSRLVAELFGRTPRERVPIVRSAFKSRDFDRLAYRLYEGVGHTMDDRFFEEAKAWLQRHSG